MSTTKTVKTACPYCGVGCGMVLQVEGGRVTKLSGDKDHPTNFGRLCTKGATAAKIIAGTGRMERASLRVDRKSDQVPVDIDAAIAETAKRLRAIIDTHGPDAVALYVSGQMALEAQYLANKLAKGFIVTNNIESNSRYCMASAASGYKLSLGADGPPGSYQDFDHADLFLLAGSNMADCHPILFLRMKDRMKSAGAKLIVVDPRRTATAEAADLFLQVRPGTDIALFNGILHLLVASDRIDHAFIAAHTDGFEPMPAFLADYTPERVAETCGIAEADLHTAADWIGAARDWMSCWTMGLSQSISGTWNTNALCNLHLATGTICRPGSGPFSLTGQPNAMGGREMGYLGYGLPGQRSVAFEDERRFTEEVWNLAPGTIRAEPGRDAASMYKAMQAGEIKAVWVICTNPVATTPNRAHAIAGLKAAELVITQDAYQDNETNIYADILLPGALWAEATGVMVNSERNLTLMEKAVEPPGEALPDWQIIAKVACAMGYSDAFSYDSAEEIFDEIKRFWNPKTGYDIRGASHARLRKTPLQWPCPPEKAESRNPTRYLNDGVSQALEERADGSRPKLAFPTSNGRAQFFARHVVAQSEVPDEDYPFVLNTGRLPHQWHTLTKTGKVPTLMKLNPGPFVEIHPDDAAALGIGAKDEVEVRSRRGKAILPASLTTRVQRGACFAPFHWNDSYGDNLAINAVTTDACDPISKQAAFKYCAVSLERVGPPLAANADVHHHAAASAHAVAPQTIEKGDVLVMERPRAQAMAAVFASAINLRPVEPPSFSDAETVYLSGFMSGLQSTDARGATPILPPDAPLAPNTRLWLDGLLAGLYSRVGVDAAAPQAVAASSMVMVLYASQTGNAEALAEAVVASLAAAGTMARATAMDDYDIDALATATRLVFVSSTYGDGDPPDNGKLFWEALQSTDAPRLEHLSYAICALGDPSYDQFCKHGKALDARLTALGARRLLDRIDCDPDHEPRSAAWIAALPPLFAGAGGIAGRVVATEAGQPPVQARATDGWSKANPFRAKLVGNVRLNGAGAGKDTRAYRFSLAGSGLGYQAGDALGVWPRHCELLVAETIEVLGLDPTAPVTIKGKGEMPLAAALTHEVELTKPSRDMLHFIAERSGSAELTALLGEARKGELKDYLWSRQLVDILADHPIRVDADDFVARLPRMQPRLYSISSSPKAHVDEVHLTVAAVRFGARKGACSTFLADRAGDGEVPVFIQPSSHFRLPVDPSVPIVMIGPGTGVAPFRGFLHERRAAGATGRNWLFFGEQHASSDFYYRDELVCMRDTGHLTELSLAFSRDQARKIYVQDRMVERGRDLWAWLDAGAYVYVCGDAERMAKDVERALVAVVRDHGGFDAEGAAAYVQGLAREKRYRRDVY